MHGWVHHAPPKTEVNNEQPQQLVAEDYVLKVSVALLQAAAHAIGDTCDQREEDRRGRPHRQPRQAKAR
jgi:hypothetical protein